MRERVLRWIIPLLRKQSNKSDTKIKIKRRKKRKGNSRTLGKSKNIFPKNRDKKSKISRFIVKNIFHSNDRAWPGRPDQTISRSGLVDPIMILKDGTFSRRLESSIRLVRDRFTPRGAYTSRLSKFCSKTSYENLYREGFPAAQQFFHTNLAARRCYWHNNRYTIGWPNPVLSY